MAPTLAARADSDVALLGPVFARGARFGYRMVPCLGPCSQYDVPCLLGYGNWSEVPISSLGLIWVPGGISCHRAPFNQGVVAGDIHLETLERKCLDLIDLVSGLLKCSLHVMPVRSILQTLEDQK